MSKIYNMAFQFGVVFNVLLFTFLNIISFLHASNNYKSIERSIIYSPAGYEPRWGFPFAWGETYFNIVEGGGTILNILIWVICGFLFGFLFKFAGSKISSRRVELN
jgi:hypothetical protein